MLTNVGNIMNRTCDKCESSKGNGNYKKLLITTAKKKDEILKTFNEKRRVGKFSTHKIC